MSFTGPFAIVIGEAAHVVFAIAEATLDVGSLRSGHRVALFKNNDNWKFSVSGLLQMIKDGAEDIGNSLTDNSDSGNSHDLKSEDEERFVLF